MADLDELGRRFREAGADHRSRSALYAHLNRRIADHPGIIAILQKAPEEQQLPVLLLAAVHSIVLAEPDVELAAWYPTIAADPRADDPFPAFARLCDARADELGAIVATRTVQTNEVGRCALLVPSLARIDQAVGPIALVDVGASAGLNLHLDRYRYRYSPGGVVGAPSDVEIECATRGDVGVPATLPRIESRVGLDRSPVDIADPAAARWLMACVWPDQADRFHRLRGAIDIAREYPPAMVRGDAVEGVAGVVRRYAVSAHPVIVNSWVLNYLPPDRRTAYVGALDALGDERDLTWIYAESPGSSPGLPFPTELIGEHLTVVMMVTWRGGERTVSHVGTGHPHGYWLHAAR